VIDRHARHSRAHRRLRAAIIHHSKPRDTLGLASPSALHKPRKGQVTSRGDECKALGRSAKFLWARIKIVPAFTNSAGEEIQIPNLAYLVARRLVAHPFEFVALFFHGIAGISSRLFAFIDCLARGVLCLAGGLVDSTLDFVFHVCHDQHSFACGTIAATNQSNDLSIVS
jgi:hypothetical protein